MLAATWNLILMMTSTGSIIWTPSGPSNALNNEVWVYLTSPCTTRNNGKWDIVGANFQEALQGTYTPNLDGNGWAAMHLIIQSIDNTANTWFSRCSHTDKTGDQSAMTAEDKARDLMDDQGEKSLRHKLKINSRCLQEHLWEGEITRPQPVCYRLSGGFQSEYPWLWWKHLSLLLGWSQTFSRLGFKSNRLLHKTYSPNWTSLSSNW